MWWPRISGSRGSLLNLSASSFSISPSTLWLRRRDNHGGKDLLMDFWAFELILALLLTVGDKAEVKSRQPLAGLFYEGEQMRQEMAATVDLSVEVGNWTWCFICFIEQIVRNGCQGYINWGKTSQSNAAIKQLDWESLGFWATQPETLRHGVIYVLHNRGWGKPCGKVNGERYTQE